MPFGVYCNVRHYHVLTCISPRCWWNNLCHIFNNNAWPSNYKCHQHYKMNRPWWNDPHLFNVWSILYMLHLLKHTQNVHHPANKIPQMSYFHMCTVRQYCQTNYFWLAKVSLLCYWFLLFCHFMVKLIFNEYSSNGCEWCSVNLCWWRYYRPPTVAVNWHVHFCGCMYWNAIWYANHGTLHVHLSDHWPDKLATSALYYVWIYQCPAHLYLMVCFSQRSCCCLEEGGYTLG